MLAPAGLEALQSSMESRNALSGQWYHPPTTWQQADCPIHIDTLLEIMKRNYEQNHPQNMSFLI